MFLSGDLARHRSTDPNDRKIDVGIRGNSSRGRSLEAKSSACGRKAKSAFDYPPRPVIRVRYRCGNDQKTSIFHQQASIRAQIGQQMTIKETVRNDPVIRIM